MKKLNLLPALLLLIISFTANSQKLPGTQQASVFAPANVKADGKIEEWNNQLQAYNNATNIFYTLANDNNNLYLAVQATDPLIIRKIMIGGLTLTIDTGKKNNGTGVAITYPAFSVADRPILNLNDKPASSKDKAQSNKALDSFVYVINKLVQDRSKEVKVQGISSITDSLISIYNENDIKVAARFDEQANYVYELALPLKYFGSPAKFNYTITLSGSPQVDGTNIIRGPDGSVLKIQVLVGRGAPPIPNAAERNILGIPTYLKGEYTLAVK